MALSVTESGNQMAKPSGEDLKSNTDFLRSVDRILFYLECV
jgi:hypothetical protein